MEHITRRAGICPKCHKRNHPLAPDEPGDLCDDCQRTLLRTSAIVVCNTCKHIAAYVEAGTTPDGFVFSAGDIYHAKDCQFCSLTSDLHIVELEAYLHAQGKEPDEFFFGTPAIREEKV